MSTPSFAPQASTPRVIRVMVLDDDIVDAEAVRRCLRSMPGFEVETVGCESLDDARRELALADVDLVFLDYRLKDRTGPEALEILQAEGLHAPAILMTGMRGEAVVLEAMQAGAVDFIPKDAIVPAAIHRATRNAIEKADLFRQIRETNLELTRAVETLERRQAELESFYHGVSHELKTPLTGAREYVSLVLDGAAGEISHRQADLLRASMRSCDRMVTCIDDMLDGSRIETGRLVVKRAPMDLRFTVQESLDALSVSAKAADVDLVLECQIQSVEAHLDAQRTYQVITNLVANAIKFSDPGARVTVALTADEDAVELCVIDQGRGIPAAQLEKIFERLFQSEEDDAAVLGGLGMGLYIARGIVRAHAGSLSVTSEVGAGSTFTVVLPRAAQAQDEFPIPEVAPSLAYQP